MTFILQDVAKLLLAVVLVVGLVTADPDPTVVRKYYNAYPLSPGYPFYNPVQRYNRYGSFYPGHNKGFIYY